MATREEEQTGVGAAVDGAPAGVAVSGVAAGAGASAAPGVLQPAPKAPVPPQPAAKPAAKPADPFVRAESEDDDGYDPYSDRPAPREPMFERDPWG